MIKYITIALLLTGCITIKPIIPCPCPQLGNVPMQGIYFDDPSPLLFREEETLNIDSIMKLYNGDTIQSNVYLDSLFIIGSTVDSCRWIGKDTIYKPFGVEL